MGTGKTQGGGLPVPTALCRRPGEGRPAGPTLNPVRSEDSGTHGRVSKPPLRTDLGAWGCGRRPLPTPPGGAQPAHTAGTRGQAGCGLCGAEKMATVSRATGLSQSKLLALTRGRWSQQDRRAHRQVPVAQQGSPFVVPQGPATVALGHGWSLEWGQLPSPGEPSQPASQKQEGTAARATAGLERRRASV